MKKILVAVLQIAVTVAVLFWVFHDPQKRAQMTVALRMADYRWIIAALICYFLVELAAGIRWWILLKVQQIHLSIARVAGLFLIGMFYNQFLPGGTGGDIMKSYLLLKETPGKATGALLAVVFDRMVGLVALIGITGALIDSADPAIVTPRMSSRPGVVRTFTNPSPASSVIARSSSARQ